MELFLEILEMMLRRASESAIDVRRARVMPSEFNGIVDNVDIWSSVLLRLDTCCETGFSGHPQVPGKLHGGRITGEASAGPDGKGGRVRSGRRKKQGRRIETMIAKGNGAGEESMSRFHTFLSNEK